MRVHFRLPFRFSSVFLPGPVFWTLLPFTLPFVFRFSSGVASLERLSFKLPFTLPFLFRDHVFFKNVDSGDFVIPNFNFDGRSLIALHRGLQRKSCTSGTRAQAHTTMYEDYKTVVCRSAKVFGER